MKFLLSAAFTIVVSKILWELTGMGDWTHLGPMPWGAAIFLGLFDLLCGWSFYSK